MAVLVLYDTVEGHTHEISERIAATLEGDGFKVALTSVNDPGYCDPATYDAAILCAPIHIGRYPPAFVNYVANWKSALNAVPNALVSVSLAIRSEHAEEREEAKAYPDGLEEVTGWKPASIHHAAGALKYLEYDFFKRWIMRRIAESEGGPVDTSKDYVLTDWDALDEFIRAFEKRIPVTG